MSNSTFFADGFPYSDVHNLNLDWIIQVCKQIQVLIGQVSDGLEIHVKDDSGSETYVFTVKSNGIYVTRPDGGTPIYYNLATGQLHAPSFDGQSILTATGRTTGQFRAGSLVLDTPLPITGGGTGAATAADALTNLGAMAADAVIPITQGGTGATTASGARNALGAVSKSGDTMTGNLTVTGATAPSYYLGRPDGTPIGMLYALASSGRLVLRGFNMDGTHYNGFRIPDTSAVTVDADYDILTSKDPVSVAQGGTGATNAEDALTALGAMPANRYATGGTATSVPANGYQDIPITFANPLPANPRVFTQIDGETTDPAVAASLIIWTRGRSTNGFTIRMFNTSSVTRSPNVLWFAIC